MSRSKRILVTFAVAGLICAAYLWLLGVATVFALEARYVAWKIPVVKKTPLQLPDQTIAQGAGRKLAYFGYEFEVPWEIDEAKSKELGQYNPQPPKEQFIAFRSGNRLTVFRIAPKEFVNNFLSMGKAVEGRCASPDDEASLALKLLLCDLGAPKALYGEDVLQSDYSFKERVLETTPDKVGLLTPRREAAASAVLLVIKGIMMPGGSESGIYRIQTGDFRGFQFGDPRSRRPLLLEIYNEEGGFSFIFAQQKNGSEPPITQAEINRVIQSLRKSSN
ncbi:MAG TPA: hypothetical protein VJN92_18070 [Candidatus Acidoferrum sp.]|nr:hypothetical protein [Candidatus Acidoferrum sp.]